MADANITIQYVNPRDGNRPPSLKDDAGNYYTLSDAAFQSMTVWKGHEGLISFYENQKGFKIATHWNSQELPKDQKAAKPPPAATAPIAPPPTKAIAPPKANGNTFPTVREQYVKEVVGGGTHAGTVDPCDFDRLLLATQNAKKVWAQVIDNPISEFDDVGNGGPVHTDLGAPPDDGAPPASEDDYGSDPFAV